MEEWHMIGTLPSGEALYCSSEGEFAKESDHKYLVRISTEEYKYLVGVNMENLKKLKSEIDN